MSKINGIRSGCRDVFRAFLVEYAEYDGDIEIPIIKPDVQIPNKLISFTKALKTNDYNQWVHFYEDDGNFERIWNSPKKYLPILKRFNGVITPDFSLYRDMPLVMQQWNTYRGKALGGWWQYNGLHVLPNVRTSDERSFSFSCCGVPKNSTICIGSHGCVKNTEDRRFLKLGLTHIVETLSPYLIIVYGSIPEDIFSICHTREIDILHFDSEFACSRKAVNH